MMGMIRAIIMYDGKVVDDMMLPEPVPPQFRIAPAGALGSLLREVTVELDEAESELQSMLYGGETVLVYRPV